MDPAVVDALLLLLVGLVAGVLNVLAGGGSFLTLPMLIFLGLPPGIANGTNRVGILMQNVAAVWSFRRQGVSAGPLVFWAAFPAALGSMLGVYLALWTSDRDFQRILAFLMVALTLGSLLSASKRRLAAVADGALSASRPRHRLALVVGFFVVGIYGGFVQAGVGLLVLAVTTWAGLDLIRGNAVKVAAILCLTALALALFAWQGRVDWWLGLCLGIGAALGGILGARLTVLAGNRWLRWFVAATVIVFAVKLWWSA